MAKDWWFKFEFNKWRNDSLLRQCSLETKGFWLEAICVMREMGTDRLKGSYADIARMVGCFPDETERCISELRRTKTADVTLGNDCVTLVSRYIKKENKRREQTKLRVRKLRGNAPCNAPVTDRVISKSKEKEIREEESTQEASAFSPHQQVLDGIRTELGILQLPNEPLWLIEIERAQKNGFTVDHCIETFTLMRRQHWRTGPIKPSTWAENLTNVANLRHELSQQNNGTNKQPSEREKSAQRTINAERMANAIRDGDDATLRSILGVDGQDHLKGYLPS